MNTIDKNMMFLLELLKVFNEIRFEKEFCDAIGVSKSRLWNIRNGINHFTPEHIKKACKEYDVNANWIIGNSKTIFNHNKYSDTKIKQLMAS